MSLDVISLSYQQVLWSTKEENLLGDIEKLITDDMFELICTWVKDVNEASFLKKSLDAVICSMCYIRPDLFKMLLERMEIPMDIDERYVINFIIGSLLLIKSLG